MGNRDKGGRETKKPKKVAPKVPVVAREPVVPTHVEVVPRKRKERIEEDDE